MYCPDDYPASSALTGKFNIRLDFIPVPDAQDFRVDVAAEAQDELRASVTAAVATRQAEAVKATYTRVHEAVSKIEERLSDEKAIFKDSLIDNARDLCIVLGALNITGDKKLADVQRAIENKLLVSPNTLRSDPVFRQHKAEEAREILLLLLEEDNGLGN
jgi:hypothetical protein